MRFRTEADFSAFIAGGQRAQQAVDVLTAAAPPARGRVRHPEDDTQRAVVQFWEQTFPDTWAKTFHPPNGIAARNRKLAAIFNGLGVKPGVFDLICIARRGGFSGFALELKSASGSMSDSQSEWQARFALEGWFTGVAFTVDVAVSLIRAYHALPVNPALVRHGKAAKD